MVHSAETAIQVDPEDDELDKKAVVVQVPQLGSARLASPRLASDLRVASTYTPPRPTRRISAPLT